MKKKSVLLVIVMLLLIQQIKAETEEQLFFDYICSGNSTTIGDKTFTAILGRGDDKVSVKLPTNSVVIVNYGSCEMQDYYRICFDSTKTCYHDYKLDKDISKAKIKISRIIADVTLTKTIDPLTLIMGDTLKINVKFQNIGGREALNVQYRDAFPSFSISDVEGCNKQGDTVYWNGKLNINQEIKCSYTIKALSNISFSSKANLSYNNGFEEKKLYSDTGNIVVMGSQLEINNKAKGKIETNEEFSFNITLKNINTENEIRVVNFEVSMPSGIEVIKKPAELKQSYNTYSWQGYLKPEESIFFEFELKSPKENIYKINEKAEFIIKNMRRNPEQLFELNIANTVVGINLSISNASLKSGEKSDISVYLTNPSSINTIKDIEIDIKTDISEFAGKSKLLSYLQPYSTAKVLERGFTAPVVYDKKSFVIDAIINYRTDSELITANKSISLVVAPRGDEKIVNETPITTETAAKKEEEQKTTITDKINSTITGNIKKIKEEGLSRRAVIIISTIVILIIMVNIFIFLKKRFKEERAVESLKDDTEQKED